MSDTPTAPAINTPPTDGDRFVADVLSSEGGRKDLHRAMRKVTDRMDAGADIANSPGAQHARKKMAEDAAAGRMADGNPHDAQGRASAAEFEIGEEVRIRSNIGNMINDGGMEGCRGVVHSVGSVQGERGVMATLTTENEEIISIPEAALERDVRPSRSTARLSGSSLPKGWHTRIFGTDRPKLSIDYCDTAAGCDGHGSQHNLTAHQKAGDPACADRSPARAPAAELALAAEEADTN